jgi:formate-dependent nitrite reductase membrane component NrfD
MIYSILGGLFGFFLASYTGVLLAHTHLSAWANTPLLGALFVASGASTGMAAIALGLVLTKVNVGESWAKLKQADNLAMILEIVLLVVLLVWLGSAAAPLLSGLSGVLLIGGSVLVGLIVPLAMQFRAGFQGVKATAEMTALVSVLVLVGGLMRTVIVMGGQGLM